MDYLTDADVAEKFGKSREWVQRKCKAGWPHLRIGKSYRFTEAHVAAIEALCEVKPAPATPAQTWGVKTRGDRHSKLPGDGRG